MGREKAASAYKEETGMSHGVIIKDAVKRYGDFTALKGVNLEIKQGEFFTLLGPSGCGKTTLLRLTGGLEQADEGEIRYGLSHKTAFVFQEPRLMPWLNVWNNVTFGLEKRPGPGKD